MNPLTLDDLITTAQLFSFEYSIITEASLYGITDGKAVGTYLEHKFKNYISQSYDYEIGNSASGIDFPSLDVDMKTTSIKQPQSSCPFKSVRQKIFGLGYSILLFVYEKIDDSEARTAILTIRHVIYIEKDKTADYITTRQLQQIIQNEGNAEDIIAFMKDRNLPIDDIEAISISNELLSGATLNQGYLTISNALQWRLQYSRVIQFAGEIDGITKIR